MIFKEVPVGRFSQGWNGDPSQGVPNGASCMEHSCKRFSVIHLILRDSELILSGPINGSLRRRQSRNRDPKR